MMAVINIFCGLQIYKRNRKVGGGGDSVGGCVVGSNGIQMKRTDREEHLKKECES